MSQMSEESSLIADLKKVTDQIKRARGKSRKEKTRILLNAQSAYAEIARRIETAKFSSLSLSKYRISSLQKQCGDLLNKYAEVIVAARKDEIQAGVDKIFFEEDDSDEEETKAIAEAPTGPLLEEKKQVEPLEQPKGKTTGPPVLAPSSEFDKAGRKEYVEYEASYTYAMSRLAEAWSGGGRLGDGQEQASIDEIVAELDSRKGGSGSLGLGTNMRVNLPSKLEKRLKEAGGAGYNLANETVKDAIFNLAKADISLENESSGGGMASRYEGTDVFGRTQL